MENQNDEDIYSVQVIKGEELIDSEIRCRPIVETERSFVSLNIPGYGLFELENSDHYTALQNIRRMIEPLGLLPRCYGASRNVHPSPRGLEAGGRMAYRLHLGKHSDGPMVDIFTYGSDVEPVSVDEQIKFYEEWRSKPKN